jgi:hypothetical protein
MDSLVTTRAPTGAPRDKSGVVETPDDNASGSHLLLHMAFQTKSLISLRQQFGIN